MAIQRHGFDGIYVSVRRFGRTSGLPDIGLTTLSEVTARGARSPGEGLPA